MGLKPIVAGMSQGGSSVATAALDGTLVTNAQTLSAAQITQALANLGIARASLSAPVTRTSTATLSNDGLEALTVSLLPSSRYRLTYRLYADGIQGVKIAFNFPTSLTRFDGTLTTYDYNTGDSVTAIYPDFPINFGGSGNVVLNFTNVTPQFGGLDFTADIKTGSTSNTYGDFSISFAQFASGATATTMSQNSCVEVLKF